jgi:hypothetical protein
MTGRVGAGDQGGMQCSTPAPRSLAILGLLALLAACNPGSKEIGATIADSEGMEVSSGSEASTGPGASATSVTTGTPPETSSSTDATATGDTSDDTTGNFLVIPDGGVCVGTGDGYWHCSRCDVVGQDCPRDEKCVPWANDGGNTWNANRCSPVPEDPAGVGQPCTAEESPVSGFDDCALGLLCFGVDPGTLEGTCAALCSPDLPETCGLDEGCATHDGFAPNVCLPLCDPLDPATCSAGQTCHQLETDLLCVPSVSLPQGLACGGDEQHCAPDQVCLAADELARCADSACCTAWCDLSAADPDLPCAAVPGHVCRPFTETPPAGYEHVGACALPL